MVLFILITITFTFSYFINIWLFPYFIFTNGIKYAAYEKYKNNAESKKSYFFIFLQAITILGSGAIAIPIASYFKELFNSQIELLNQIHNDFLSKTGYSIYADFEIIAAWGIVYFFAILLIDIIFFLYERKEK